MKKTDPKLLEVRKKIDELLDKHPDLSLYMLGWLKDTINRLKGDDGTAPKKNAKLDALSTMVSDSKSISHQVALVTNFVMMRESANILKDHPGAYTEKPDIMKTFDNLLTMVAATPSGAFNAMLFDAKLAAESIEKLHQFFNENRKEEE